MIKAKDAAKNGYVPVWMLACDKLSHAIDYLQYSWGIDTPRAEMQANLDARAILIRLKKQIIDTAELEMELNKRMEYCSPSVLEPPAPARHLGSGEAG